MVCKEGRVLWCGRRVGKSGCEKRRIRGLKMKG